MRLWMYSITAGLFCPWHHSRGLVLLPYDKDTGLLSGKAAVASRNDGHGAGLRRSYSNWLYSSWWPPWSFILASGIAVWNRCATAALALLATRHMIHSSALKLGICAVACTFDPPAHDPKTSPISSLIWPSSGHSRGNEMACWVSLAVTQDLQLGYITQEVCVCVR